MLLRHRLDLDVVVADEIAAPPLTLMGEILVRLVGGYVSLQTTTSWAESHRRPSYLILSATLRDHFD
uniref:Uncharacterized protein n=3 Tax=Oryza TaxID=4527 RepID=A0A0E0Q2I0_ORYRU